MELPDWFVLLNEWPSSGLGERGVTLPFLVGALAIKDQREPDPESARSLLEKITAQVPEDFIIEVGWCSNPGGNN